MGNGRVTVLAVLPDRTKATVKAFLQSIPERLQTTIDTICSDMYRSYIYAAREVLGATVVADRYAEGALLNNIVTVQINCVARSANGSHSVPRCRRET